MNNIALNYTGPLIHGLFFSQYNIISLKAISILSFGEPKVMLRFATVGGDGQYPNPCVVQVSIAHVYVNTEEREQCINK